MTRRNWPEIFATHPNATDAAIGRIVGVTRAAVTQQRDRHMVARAPRVPKPVRRGFYLTEMQAATLDALAALEGVPASTWSVQAIVERMERVQRRMQRLAPTLKVGDRVRWVGPSPDGWMSHWGGVGDAGEVTAISGDGACVRWDRNSALLRGVPAANLAPATDYFGHP